MRVLTITSLAVALITSKAYADEAILHSECVPSEPYQLANHTPRSDFDEFRSSNNA